MEEPLSAVDALIKLGGVAGTASVVRLSSRRRVNSAIRRGDIVRVTRNRLAVPTAEHGLVAARERNGYVSHLSAALHYGWEVKFPPDLPQVTVDDRQSLPEEPKTMAEVLRRRLRPEDRKGWATSMLRVVLDCARDLSFCDALCVADSALRHGDITKEELDSAAASETGPKAAAVRLVAAYADGRAAGPFESALRALAIHAGLEVLPQYEIRCGDLELHPDLANPILGIVLEADSYEFHGREPWDHNRDCDRYNAMVVAGWLVLRFTWEQVMHYPDYVIRTIRLLMQERQAA